MRLKAADAEIDRGIAAVARAAKPRTPFFRFPGFASSPALIDRMQARGLVLFGADLWASDWDPMSPAQELALTLSRFEAARGGIVPSPCPRLPACAEGARLQDCARCSRNVTRGHGIIVEDGARRFGG